jgi:hypothetical protein
MTPLKYMYEDQKINLLFYAYPSGTPQPTVIFKIRIKETMVTGDKDVNWTSAQGGRNEGLMPLIKF